MQKLQPYERILTSINLLIENSKEMQDRLEGIKSIDSPLYTSKEYCTIKVCTSRQTGHTTAIKEFVLEKAYKNNEKWAILSITSQSLNASFRYVINAIQSAKVEYHCKFINTNKIVFENGGEINFISMNSNNSLRGRELDGIIVDCSSIISQKKIDQLYQDGYGCMINKKYKLFIFVE